jgi:hypothetical protein
VELINKEILCFRIMHKLFGGGGAEWPVHSRRQQVGVNQEVRERFTMCTGVAAWKHATMIMITGATTTSVDNIPVAGDGDDFMSSPPCSFA